MADDRIQRVTMPKWGLSMKTGKIIEWFVGEGDLVGKGDDLADIETEKIAGTLESPLAGPLRRIVAVHEVGGQDVDAGLHRVRVVLVAGEPVLQDPKFWTKISRFHRSPSQRAGACGEIADKIEKLRSGAGPDCEAGVSYLQRSLIEAFISGIVDEVSSERYDRLGSGAKLVRDVEDYVDGVEIGRPVHISELCSALTVSRRTLHRAFQHSLGLGPVTYLRLRRLADVHRMLIVADAAPAGVTQAALDYGFTDLGRFAAFYKRIFGEVPSETRHKATGQLNRS